MTFHPFVENSFEFSVTGGKARVAKLPDPWKWKWAGSEWSKVKNTAGGCMNNKASWQNNPRFKFGLRTKSLVKFFLSQIITAPPPGQAKKPPTPAGFYIFKFTTAAFTKSDFVGKSEFAPTREGLLCFLVCVVSAHSGQIVAAEFDLEAGIYFLIPSKFEANEEGGFSVHLFSQNDVAIALV